MFHRWRILFGLCVAWLYLADTAHGYDPSLRWRTLETPHFRLHHPDTLYDQALDMARAAEFAFAELTQRLAWQPSTPIDLVLIDDVDSANGSARVLPYKLVTLNGMPPDDLGDLIDYDDWHYGLVSHELTHIVHIDTIKGLPRVLNHVFGRWFAPNGVQPRWVTEGIAVYMESVLTGGGRVRSRYTDMVLRMAVLDKKMVNLSNMTGVPWRWPQGSIPYLFGGRFIDYIAKQHGEKTLTFVSHDYGARLFPYLLNVSIERSTDKSYNQLYNGFSSDLTDDFARTRVQIEAEGLIEGKPLTHSGQEVGPARAGPDGRIFYVDRPIDDHAAVKAVQPDGAIKEITWAQQDSRIALLPGGKAAIASILNTHAVFKLRNDLYHIDLVTGKKTQLTHGARIFEPDVCIEDGVVHGVVFVQNEGSHSVLRMAPLAHLTDEARTLVDLGDTTQVWTPRCSPDGSEVVFSAMAGSVRDIYRVQISTGALTRITHDRAIDGGPVYSRDGAWIIYHSDRDGIYNLYALPREGGGEPRRITRVLGGAFHPEPSWDGQSVIYRTYSSHGFDLAQIAMPQSEIAHAPVGVAAPENRPVATARERYDVYPVHEYTPWRSLLPRAWMPLVGQDTRGNTLGLTVNGADAVGRHSYALTAYYGLLSNTPGFVATYDNNTFYPGFQLQVGKVLGTAAYPYVRNGRGYSVEENIWAAHASTSYLLWARRDINLSFRVGYGLTWRNKTRPFVIDPLDRGPIFPDQGRFASTQLGLRLSTTQVYINSISPEEGGYIDISTNLEHPYLGSQYQSARVVTDVGWFFENPWWSRHVLALQGSFGYGVSNYKQRRLFSISGMLPFQPLNVLLTGTLGASGTALRGYGSNSFSGDALLQMHAEYRFPIYDILEGFRTWPVYLRTIHAALFTDGAAVANQPSRLANHQFYTAGAELRLNMSLGYALPAILRLGYGHSLTDRQQQQFFVTLSSSL